MMRPFPKKVDGCWEMLTYYLSSRTQYDSAALNSIKIVKKKKKKLYFLILSCSPERQTKERQEY